MWFDLKFLATIFWDTQTFCPDVTGLKVEEETKCNTCEASHCSDKQPGLGGSLFLWHRLSISNSAVVKLCTLWLAEEKRGLRSSGPKNFLLCGHIKVTRGCLFCEIQEGHRKQKQNIHKYFAMWTCLEGHRKRRPGVIWQTTVCNVNTSEQLWKKKTDLGSSASKIDVLKTWTFLSSLEVIWDFGLVKGHSEKKCLVMRTKGNNWGVFAEGEAEGFEFRVTWRFSGAWFL